MPLIPPGLVPKTDREWQRYFTESIVTADNLREFTVAQLSDVPRTIRVCFVTNEAGGYTIAFFDGTNWRRVQDLSIVS